MPLADLKQFTIEFKWGLIETPSCWQAGILDDLSNYQLHK